MVRRLTHGARAREGGLDTAVANEFGCERTKKCFALVSGLVQLGNALTVAHSLDFWKDWERWGQRERGMLGALREGKAAKFGAGVGGGARESGARR